MFTIIFVVVLVLFADQGKALEAESTCCEEIQSLLENKTTAYQTACLGAENRLSSNCCRDIETDIEKYRYVYKTLCHEVVLTPTPIVPSTEPPVRKCKTSLGIENGRISDASMTSSSILDNSSFPHYARLRNQNGRNCEWIPATSADHNSTWLQIDLGNVTNVSAVATQGSCSGDQWTKSYVIIYSKNGEDWKTYEDLGSTVFIGNNDSNGVVTNYFKTPFEARFVRISPRSWHKNAALRIELFTDSCSLSPVSSSKPRSCLAHLKNGLKTNGYYNIYDANSNLVTVYCDMTSESGKAWTLITSWATRNKDKPEFQSTPFSTDSPVNDSLPNWDTYRMSLSMMNDLSAQSTHWRATCSFPTHGVDYRDYVRGKFADLDVINFVGTGDCETVEYVNIRGHQRSDCTAPWYQDKIKYFLHIASNHKICQFDASSDATYKEDNFGHYKYINPAFRCTADDTATTNWWFGKSLA